MTETVAQRVHQLLTDSMDMPSDQRRQFLHQVCAEDSRLASQLERLLHAIDDSHSFLERPALASVASDLWQAEPELPERIGNYRIIQQLGSGGMGLVYEAIQDQPQRTVALKIPRRRKWNARLQQQLKEEAEILGRLRHPHIAQVFEAGIDNSNPLAPIAYIAMEFVPGARTLSSYIRERHFSQDEILQMMIKICDAVQHGHRLGIIHCDLKPANILVDSDNNPKVIDFGVASSREAFNVDCEEPETSCGSNSLVDFSANDRPDDSPREKAPHATPAQFGTLNYMSPEQCDGREFLDARTDVYSLGVVLYQMLCDDLPFCLQGLRTDQAMQVICEQPYREPRRGNRILSRDLWEILKKSLAKEREQRYSTADALGADLKRILTGFPISARAATPWYVGWRFVQRNRLLVGASGLILCAIVAGLVASATFAYRTSLESQRRQEAELQASRERDDAVWQSYVANMAAGFASFNNLSQLRLHLEAAPQQHRDWEWYFLASAAGSGERVVEAHSQMIQALAVSHDESRAATGAEDGRIRIWNTTTWELLVDIPRPTLRGTTVVSPSTGVSAIAFRDGDQQVVSGMTDGSIRIWNAQTGDLIRELKGHENFVSSLSVHPDGTIASASWGNRGRLWDGNSENWFQEINDQQQRIQGVAFCNQGNQLLTWEPRGSIWLRDYQNDANDATGAPSATIVVSQKFQHPGDLRRVAISHTGRLIAAGGKDNRIHLFRVDSTADEAADTPPVSAKQESGTRVHVATLPGNRSSTDSLCFSQDDTVVVVGRVDQRIEALSTETFATVARLRGHDDFVSGVWLNSSADHLVSVSGDGTIRVWPMKELRQVGNIAASRQRDERVYDIAFSPDGSRLVSAGDKNIRLWQLDLRTYSEPVQGHPGGLRAVAWSADGRLLAAGGSDRIIRLTEIGPEKTVELPIQHSQTITALEFSPDGQYLVAADASGSIRIWNVVIDSPEFGTQVELAVVLGQRAHQRTINQVKFSRDGRLLASASNDRSVRVWDFEQRKLAVTLEGHHLSDVFAVVFSPDGKLLYSGSRDRTIAVWSLGTGKFIETLTGRSQLIRCLDMNSAGTRLVAGTWFGDVLLWDLQRHELVATFQAHPDIIHAIKFDPSGQLLATCSYDQSIRLHQSKDPSIFQGRNSQGR